MAWQVTKRIWDTAREIKQSDKLLLLALAEFADEHSVCWPSYETLAEMIGVNRRSAIRIVENLEEWGHIYIDQHVVGRSNTNTFLIVTGLTPPQVEQVLIERFGKSPDDARVSTDTLMGKRDDYRKGVIGNTKSFPESGRYKRPKGVKADIKSVTDNTISHSQKGVMRDKKVLPVTQKGVMDDTRTIIEPSIEPSSKGESPPFGPLTQALADICKLNRETIQRVTGKELFATQEAFYGVGITPAQVLEFDQWRKAHHWSGKKGNDPPSLKQVGEFWGQYEDWVKRGRPDVPAQPQNGANHGTHRRGSRQTKEQLTGHDSKLRATVNPLIGEAYLPDGTIRRDINDTS